MFNTTKYILLFGLFMIFITACSPTTETETKEKFFLDKALEAAVLKELSSKDVNAEEDDFASIESLEVSEAGITDIEGIEKLTSLNYLDLTGNDIDDLSPLLSLENLSEVDLGDVYFTGD
ncbi:MAG: leucine-rich repeat domain-containing protein, partial [Paenisporosarcina sp.]